MIWREVWVSKRLSIKIYFEIIIICYREYYSKDGFVVSFFGNSVVK